MAGIYIHIPFCKQACSYCNFHFSTLLNNKKNVLDAIKKEIILRKTEQQAPIQTIYFGGGTPSILDDTEIDDLLETIHTHYTIEPNIECTLEANPDDLSKEKLNHLAKTNINRLSIGVQSFFDIDLRFMNRAHSAQEAFDSIKLAQDVGLDQISIDLIYGTPTTTTNMWLQNIQNALDLNIQHLSAYALTVEPKTALAHQIQTKKIPKIDDDKQAKHFELLQQTLNNHDFVHYEVSNFAKEGYFAKHNSGYWQQQHYLGFGPSAHSYNGKIRSWNLANNQIYVKQLGNNQLPSEFELLSQKDQFNEAIMIGLRTMFGVDLDLIKTNFPNDYYSDLMLQIKPYIKSGQLTINNHCLCICQDYWFFADGIAADLFRV